ncbi:MAG: hypothetical protein AAFR84_15525, partial [Pseudomonadota bacterium]
TTLRLAVQDQANRALAYFRGKLVRRLAHGAPSYSEVEASSRPGAVHRLQQPEDENGKRKCLVAYISLGTEMLHSERGRVTGPSAARMPRRKW